MLQFMKIVLYKFVHEGVCLCIGTETYMEEYSLI